MLFQQLKSLCRLLTLFACSINLVQAEPVKTEEILAFKPVMTCPIAKTADHGHAPIYFFHHRFSEGAQDLAIIKPESGADIAIKRVTFENSITTGCLSRYLAIAQGDNWGWHLLWMPQNSNALHYARMDGEAWVTSPTKVLAKQARPASEPILLTSGLGVWVVWVEANSNVYSIYAAYSDDEGRNWQHAESIGQVDHEPGDFKLVEKENKPYLSGQGLTGLLPLIGR